MSFDELLGQLHRRMNEYRSSGNPESILSADALTEAARIWEIVQPEDETALTVDQRRRLAQAHNTLGWLHYLRWNASGAQIDSPEFARALLLFEPLAQEPDAIPEQLRNVIGPVANPRVQADMAHHLLPRGMATNDPYLLSAAINLLVSSVATVDELSRARARYLANLSTAYRIRFEQGGSLTDMNRSIDVAAEAVQTARSEDPDRAGCLSTLSAAHQTRYERTGEPDDLDRAIEIGEKAVGAAAPDDPHKGTYSHNLGVIYQARYQRNGHPDDLDQAILLMTRTLGTIGAEDPNRESCLSNLCIAYRLRYERNGRLEDLDRAIEAGADAIQSTRSSAAAKAVSLHNLGTAYQARYERTGVLEDLDRATRAAAEAAEAIPAGHAASPAILSNLSNAYRFRYQRTVLPEDLNRAIEAGAAAVAVTPSDYADRAPMLSTLGNAYRLRYERNQTLADIDRAISAISEAVHITPARHHKRAAYLLNLSAAHRLRYGISRESKDLDRAVETITEAIDLTPADHPHQALCLSTLGEAHRARVDAGLDSIDRTALQALAEQVAQSTAATPLHRVRAGLMVGSLAHAMHEDHLAVTLLDAAVGFLPSVPPREAGWADQEHTLAIHAGVVQEAVAAHCAINDPAGAVEVAELGRGILLAAQLDSRAAPTELEIAHPDLAEQYRTVRERLSLAENRKQWWDEYDSLLARIRRHQGFERFLLPPDIGDLRRAAGTGTVVLVNAGLRRGDAVIITAHDEPRHIPLRGLTLEDANRHTLAMLDAARTGLLVADPQELLPRILAWLWDAVVGRVLDALPPAESAEGSSRRVWWMPTGVLGLLPLHAAGRPGEPGALDAIVSSYTPTLRALAHSRARPAATVRRQLTVALRHTRDLPDLPGTVAEALHLHAQHPDTPLLIDQDATAGAVLTALPTNTWAHFACHASIDYIAPSRGGLQLHDAAVPIPDISQLHLDRAELAYLSACSTAGRGPYHADESIHLASAFQLAGFRHVIASLWPLDDEIAATAARDFYNHLPPTPTADTAAHALHRVTLDLRTNHPKRPDLWAPLIHTGP